jgi:hypothetical protein
MFGYRLIRASELDDLRAQLSAARADNVALHERLLAEVRDSTNAVAEARSTRTLADMLTRNANLAEDRAARYEQARTGVPQTVAPIVAGPPLRSEMVAEGGSLFEDVGDERAEQMRRQNLLHDTEPDVPFMLDGINGPPH